MRIPRRLCSVFDPKWPHAAFVRAGGRARRALERVLQHGALAAMVEQRGETVTVDRRYALLRLQKLDKGALEGA